MGEGERYEEAVRLLMAEGRLRLVAALRPDARSGLIRLADRYSERVRRLLELAR